MTNEAATAEFEGLEDRIAAWIDARSTPGAPDTAGSGLSFDALAREIFAFQFRHNAPYRAWCHSLGVDDPASLPDWQAIPALPSDAFKHQGRSLTVLPALEPEACFRTSGTTRDRSQRGEHLIPRLRLYEKSIDRAWDEAALPRLPPRFLIPSPEEAPDSSLAHMTGVLTRSLTTGANPWLLRSGEDGAQLCARLVLSLEQAGGEPCLIFGTALAFRHLLEARDGDRIPLPPGSALMETGGYKDRQDLALDKEAFYERLCRTFDVDTEAIWNEYSMTELSSQTYARGLGSVHQCPPWLRVRVVDPETRRPAALGQPGYLEFFDLANLGSCLAIRTADIALPDPDSEGRRFTLLGRDPSALPRGCSRSADEMLSRQGPGQSGAVSFDSV